MATTSSVASLARQFGEAFNRFTAFLCIVAQILNLTGDFEEKPIREALSLSCPSAALSRQNSTPHGNFIQKTDIAKGMSIRGPSPGQVLKAAAALDKRRDLSIMRDDALHMEKIILRKDGLNG